MPERSEAGLVSIKDLPTYIRGPSLSGFGFVLTTFTPHHLLVPLPCVSTMADKSQRPKRRDGVLPLLDVTINGLNLAKELSSITPAKAVFGSVAILLAMIKVSFVLFYNISSSHVVRTRWSTNRITSSSGYSVPIYVKP